jgi:hypothetical protein
MPNNTATLRGYLRTALRDEDAAAYAWTDTELNNIVDWSVARLWPRHSTQPSNLGANQKIYLTSTVTAASFATGSVTYTCTNTIPVGAVVDISGITPVGYNVTNGVVTSRTDSTIVIAKTDPGAYVSGGLVENKSYRYHLHATIAHVTRCDWISDDGQTEYGALDGQSWEVLGNPEDDNALLYVAPIIVEQGGTLRLHAHIQYDTTANYIPDRLIPLIVARARAEAYRRLAADRQKFKAWLSRNQEQNITVNELLQMINEADNEAMVLDRGQKSWQKPVPGRRA